MHYTVWQWLLFFYIYCFFGWCFESTFVSVRKRRFVNRGFLHSPLLPIYGFGAVIMLLVTLRIREHPVLMFFAGMAGATLLELVVGLSMEAVFKIKYWDYSNQRFNYKGVICLSSSICWGFFTVLLNKAIHRPVEAFVLGLPQGVTLAAALAVTAVFLCDVVLSVKVALGIRDMLDARNRLQKELSALQDQLSERVEAMRISVQEKTGQAGDRLGSIVDSLGDKLSELSEAAGARAQKLLDGINERFEALSQLAKDKEDRKFFSRMGKQVSDMEKRSESQTRKMAYLKVKMLKRNPTATSGKFSREFSQLREMVKKYDRRKKKK